MRRRELAVGEHVRVQVGRQSDARRRLSTLVLEEGLVRAEACRRDADARPEGVIRSLS
jgi:hypothetical protein